MKPLHYPDIDRCKKLTEIGFPETEKDVCCPSVMEMLDVIPHTVPQYFVEITKLYDTENHYLIEHNCSNHERDTFPEHYKMCE